MPERFTRDWHAAEPRGAVALIHGLAEHSGRYEHVAARLSGAGYAVSAVDLSGHGRSDGWPGKVTGIEEWLDDAAFVMARARAAAGDGPAFLLGHSMGSLVATAFTARADDPPTGLVLTGYAGLAGPALLEAMGNPDAPGIPPEALSRDPAVVRAYAEDPLVFNEHVSPECNAAALEMAIAANGAAASITIPVLMVHGGSDTICDPEGAREFHRALGSTDSDLIVYEELFHEVMNEPDRDRVLDDIVAWLDRHTG